MFTVFSLAHKNNNNHGSASRLIQSSLSQSLKAARITEIQLRMTRKKKHTHNVLLHPPHVCVMVLVLTLPQKQPQPPHSAFHFPP